MQNDARNNPLEPQGVQHKSEDLSLYSGLEKTYIRAAERPLRVAIVGAGLSGLIAARILKNHGHSVQIFEKTGEPGGRISSVRHGGATFDTGAQYFTVRDNTFRKLMKRLIKKGLVQQWNVDIRVLGRSVPSGKRNPPVRYVGTPTMSAVPKHLASSLEIFFDTHVTGVERSGKRWLIHAGEKNVEGRFDVILISVPPPQARSLIASIPSLHEKSISVGFTPCWAVTIVFTKKIALEFDAAFIHGSPVSWAARNSSKPSRTSSEAWVLHGNPDWSHTHIRAKSEFVVETLLRSFLHASGCSYENPVSSQAVLWTYAKATSPISTKCLWDASVMAGLLGDWCSMSRVEGAFLSGAAAADRVLCTSRSGRKRHKSKKRSNG
jgi:hypothetical protein